jgi:hypothetical protein
VAKQRLDALGGSMTNFCGGSDAAVEQLYDELMARTWALHSVVPSAATDVSRADVSTRLAAAAFTLVRDLRELAGHPGALHALLWPTGSRPLVGDTWWATPLGMLMSPAQPASTQTNGDVTVDVVDDLVAS